MDSPDDPAIGAWLDGLGLGRYRALFAAQELDMETLAEVGEQDLEAWGVPFGPRKRLAKAIAALRGEPAPSRASSPGAPPLGAPPLGALSQAGERRQVTVMFCDMVGSSRLALGHDPEDVREVMRAYRDICEAAIARYEGFVVRYFGDGVLACFGWPEAHEDDAERAVLSGLALLAAARTERSRLAVAFGPGSEAAAFDVRVGINTGTVLIGAGALGESSIRGHAVNVAARMEQSAPAGGLRIAHATWRLVRGRFDVLAEAPRRLKAHDEPLVSYLVRGERPVGERRTARGLDGVALPLVGRADELERLRALAIEVRGGSGLGIAWLGGEAGIGKTRLADEFDDELRAAGWLLLQGTAQPAAVAAPYALWREPVARLLEMAAVAGGPVVQGLAADAAESPGADPDTVALDAVFLRHLFGLGPQQAADADRAAATGALAPFAGDAEALRERALQALWRLVERACGVGRPVLLRFEDLHWADEASLDLIGRLVERGAALSLLVVATSRPAAEAAHSAALESAFAQAAVQRVELAPLAGDALEALADRLAAQRGDAAPPLRARLVGEGQGNPFFMEELAAVALAQPSQTPDASAVPATLNAVLLARVDALPDAQRRALLAASIVGPVFEAGALAAVDEGARDALAALLELPDGAVPIAILCLGPVAGFYERPLLELTGWRQARPLAELLYDDQWPVA
jgi:class 3 adenylate cyclase